jgi:anthranilate/para-aminobenzoate synthase component I
MVSIDADLSALNEEFARLDCPAILGGNPAKLNGDGFSYWAAEPREIFEFGASEQTPFEKLRRLLNKYIFEPDSANEIKRLLPRGVFVGGWIGYFSYDLGKYIEKLPQMAADDLGMPLIRLCFYDRLIAYDHQAQTFWLIAMELPGDTESPDEKLAGLEKLLIRSSRVNISPPQRGDIEHTDIGELNSNMDRAYYLRAFEKTKRYIYDGDVYQINLSQRFDCEFRGRPIDLYHWQNGYNPSPFAAYLDGGGFSIVSASPELFVRICDGCIQTKPIKGTRPRLSEISPDAHRAAEINAHNYAELLHSEKEQAELNMIIDLERNDLARVCVPGTRTVSQPRTIEAHPTVFHAVATVGGQLRDDVSLCEVLKAMFPGGSITGAPKVRAMQIIEQLEPTARGLYTGSIGYIGVDGSVCLNIAIRTIIITNRRAYVQTGGGIVADSDPQAEWDETITKARALLAAIYSVERRADSVQCGADSTEP